MLTCGDPCNSKEFKHFIYLLYLVELVLSANQIISYHHTFSYGPKIAFLIKYRPYLHNLHASSIISIVFIECLTEIDDIM